MSVHNTNRTKWDMKINTILEHLEAGKSVTYTIRRLRGYLHGDASLVFQPHDYFLGANNIQHRLKCFRFDEKPYDNPRWNVGNGDRLVAHVQ